MICPNPKCGRIVSPFDEKCQHCGTPLETNPIKEYEKKAGQIIKDAESRVEDIKGQIRSGFKGPKKFTPFASDRDNTSTGEFSECIDERKTVRHEYDDVLESKYRLRSHDIDEIISQRKDVRVKEAFGIVFSNPEITGNPDNARKAARTDQYYFKEDMEVSGIDPLIINAYADHNEKSDRYIIIILDGYLNFMLVAECFFRYKDKNLLASLKKIIETKGKLSLNDTKDLILPFTTNWQNFSEILENAFAPLLETIAHEIGHICLNHCDDQNKIMTYDKSKNRERRADSFASTVINSFYATGAQTAALEAYLKNCFIWAIVEGDRDGGTHPLAKERFKNAVKANSELAEKLGIAEDIIDEIGS